MTDLTDRVRAALSGRYTLEHQVGRGGMATVFLASDTRHDRRVAVKVLDPEIARAIGPERFLAEIEIAARLTHPNILPLHDSGDEDGLLYYVMPYVEGESLADRLRRERQLKLDDAVEIVNSVAQALTHAHRQGVVHRDIKPENILLMDGRAVVADFGIARAVDGPAAVRLTETGVAVGTPVYMSPEQASGDRNVDARTDVYSLGCVAYEMLGGNPPFTGPSPQAVRARHAVDPVPPLRTLRPNLPAGAERAIEKALAKVPADRFDTADDFATALARASTAQAIEAEVRRERRSGRRRALAGAGVVAVLAALGWGAAQLGGGPSFERLAVLAPVNLRADTTDTDFGRGLHMSLISELQRAGVPVIARTSMLQYENSQKSISTIATELNVDAIAEPVWQRTGDSIEIQVRLVSGRTEEYVGDAIVRVAPPEELLNVYRQMTRDIAMAIDAPLAPQVALRLAETRTVNPEAFQASLTGWLLIERMNPADLATALEYFQDALGHDSTYAAAHAGVAAVWSSRVQLGVVPAAVGAPRAKAAAERAIALDSTSAEAFRALATVRVWGDWDWTGGDAAFRRSIEINPGDPFTRAGYAHLLAVLGRSDEAVEQIETAVALDPGNLVVRSFYSALLVSVDRHAAGLAEAEAVLRRAPNHVVALTTKRGALLGMRRWDEALAATRARAEFMGQVDVVAAIDTANGYQDAMARAAEALAAQVGSAFVRPIMVAGFYAQADQADQALDWLERALEARDPGMVYVRVTPEWDGLHQDERFRDLLRQMSLPLP